MRYESLENCGKKAMPEMEKPLLDYPEALAAKESNKGSNALKHSERIASLSNLKKRSRQMASYMLNNSNNPLDYNVATNVSSCSSWLVFNHYYTVDEVRLSKARTCKKHLLCPVCAKIRSVKQAVKYMERLEEILKEFPNLVPAMLTLTVKNGDDLKERFNHLTSSWKKYQNRRRQWVKTNRGFNELCRTTGGVFSYEFTKSKKGWHPHLHAIVLLDSKMDVRKLSDEWKEITGDSYIVDIRKIGTKNKQDIADGFLEVFKYALKFSELDLSDNLHVYMSLRGKRLQGAYGAFWGVVVPEKMTDELLDDLPYIELFYQYVSGKGYNLEKTKKHLQRIDLSSSEEEFLY